MTVTAQFLGSYGAATSPAGLYGLWDLVKGCERSSLLQGEEKGLPKAAIAVRICKYT